jgi:Cytochrome c7 and related cytochrome c
LICFLAFACVAFAWPRLESSAAGAGATPQRRTQTRPSRSTAPPRQRVDYTHFSHRTQQHQLACDNCHKFPSANWQQVRKKDAAFPDITEYPEHQSCLNCHRQQFFARERPAPAICVVCHVANSPRNTTRYPFPSLGAPFLASPRGAGFTSDFQVFFPHDKHIDIVGQLQPTDAPARTVSFVNASFKQEKKEQKETKPADSPDKSCAVCHQTYMPQGTSEREYVTEPPKTLGDAFWLKKGTFKTIPDGHTTCFTCHSQDNADLKPGPADCATCHKLAPATPARTDFAPKVAAAEGINDPVMLAAWRKRTSAANFRHEGGMHPDLSCMDCHKVTTMNTLDAESRKVHVLSCGGGGTGCHVTPTSDDGGALNLEIDGRKASAAFQCAKCHLIYGREQLPASHVKAVEAFQKK